MEIKVPSVGESVTEVTLAEWLVPVGAYVEVDQPLLLIESDKADMEIPAPASGVLVEQRIGPGEDANVGDVLGIFEPGEASASAEQVAPDPLTEPAETSTGHVMPAAARALHDAGMSATEVSASGPGGRILKEDVAAAKPAPAAESVAPPATPPAPASAPSSTSTGTGEEQVVRMSRLRQTIATRLVCAQNEAALLTTFNEVDMSAVMDLRKRHQDAFVKRHGIKLGFMSFFIKAAIEALKEYPAVNAEIRGKEMVFKNYYDIGVAIGGGKGLVVPVLRSADALSMAGIEKAIAEYAGRAKAGSITMDELQGGTFSITNGGIYGSMLSTPIVNPPQSGILGMHNIVKRAVVVGDEIVIRPMMYVALTYDHRVVDGREAVSFLKRIKECIEDPARILVEA
ncbi:MAG: 2-oxoglutarate dehydrogenase complex dihydrolipoyllysine-residue succinyltransferase [Myxococcota bacterium]|nr:2-oxoglutarate dehydrogenase complex dihydrolipoyllysine-residue succinyltransferase [Myxococcota bacterium]